MPTPPLQIMPPSSGDDDDWKQNIEEDIRDLKDNDKETFTRLNKLERFQSFVLGAAAAIGAVGGYLVAWIRGDK